MTDEDRVPTRSKCCTSSNIFLSSKVQVTAPQINGSTLKFVIVCQMVAIMGIVNLTVESVRAPGTNPSNGTEINGFYTLYNDPTVILADK